MIREFVDTDKIALKAAAFFVKARLSPNQWTFLSLVPAVAGFAAGYYGHLVWAAFLFLLAGLMDGIDGGLARYTGRSTHLGAFIDGVVDRFIDFLAVFLFLFISLPDLLFPVSIWVSVQLYFALMPTFIVAYANHRQAVIDPREKVVWRIMHRTEMYPLWVLSMLAAAFSPAAAVLLFAFTTVMSVITAFQSFFLAIYKSKDFPQKKG